MFEALSIGATGMQAQQLSVETIANNLANANTVAFKKGRVGFSDLMVHEGARVPTAAVDDPRQVQPAHAGAGVAVNSLARVFDQGELKKTDAPMDVAIRGGGFIEVTMSDGTSAYTRGGTLTVNRDGLIATQAGQALKPTIHIPENAESIAIGADGKVLVRVPNQVAPVEAGQLDLVSFNNPGQLTVLGDNLYRATEGSGDAVVGRPGEQNVGFFAQGFLEASNVKMVDEMVNLILAQRAYEASVKVVQAADEMLGMVNNLRK